MILKKLRNSYSAQITLFVVIPVLLWIPSFISPEKVYEPEVSGILYSFIVQLFGSLGLVSTIVAFVLVLFQGLLLNIIFTTNLLTPKTSFLPAILFVTCFSFLPQFHTISPILFINLLVLLTLRYLFRAYSDLLVFDSFFNACFCISIITLIYPPAWILLLVIPISIFVYRIFTWRIWIISFLGILFPYIILIIYYWMTDKLDADSLSLVKNYYLVPKIDSINKAYDIFLGIATTILLLVALRISLNISSDNLMSIKRKTQVLLCFSLLALPISFNESVFPINIMYLSIFFAFAYTHLLYKKWKPILLNLLFLLLITVIIVGNLLK